MSDTDHVFHCFSLSLLLLHTSICSVYMCMYIYICGYDTFFVHKKHHFNLQLQSFVFLQLQALYHSIFPGADITNIRDFEDTLEGTGACESIESPSHNGLPQSLAKQYGHRMTIKNGNVIANHFPL